MGLKKGEAMPEGWKRNISAGLRGNKHRLGVPHDAASKAKISASLKKAYADGRHAINPQPQNLSQFNLDVRSGAKAAPWRKIESDQRVAELYREMANYEAVGRLLGVTGAAVRQAVARCH